MREGFAFVAFTGKGAALAFPSAPGRRKTSRSGKR